MDSKQLIFYDKAKERKKKGFDKPSGNLLRYELRLMKNASYFLKPDKIYANRPL
jgi:hypothetical protein